ncbi:hypothetical protein [Polaromonas sp.]|uniref:hypothetical protein n=1 Tax=Polaromonas sp. TaxID=1869339 RepID=UPI002FCBFEB5
MNHTYRLKMRAALWAMLGIACVASTPTMAAEPAWWTQQKIACGLPSSLAYNNWDGKCNSSPGGAARRVQEAEATAAAERQRQAEAERIERERLAEEKRKKDEEFIRNRDATASTLKGSSGAAMSQLKGPVGRGQFQPQGKWIRHGQHRLERASRQ